MLNTLAPGEDWITTESGASGLTFKWMKERSFEVPRNAPFVIRLFATHSRQHEQVCSDRLHAVYRRSLMAGIADHMIRRTRVQKQGILNILFEF